MRSDSGAPRVIATATALACWVLSMGLLVALPLLGAGDSGLPALVTPRGSPLWWATTVALTAQSLALTWIRSTPRAVLLLVTAISLVLALLAPGLEFTLTHLAVLLAVFLAAPRRPLREMLGWLALTAIAVAAGTVLNGLRSGISTLPGVLGEAIVQGIGTVGIAALASLALASIGTAREAQRKEIEALARERDALGRERDAQVKAAASEERAAMARELHDIAAHHLSGIALMAAAADRQIDGDPPAAHDSLHQIRTQSRTVLDDIRRVVGLLRDGEPAERSVENLATVPALVGARVGAGLAVRLEELTAPEGRQIGDRIGPLAQLVAYRMIQESLTNVVEHAPGAQSLVTVDDTDPDSLTVTVSDDGAAASPGAGCRGTGGSGSGHEISGIGFPGPRVPPDGSPGGAGPGGFGLVGMRERADLVGAQLDHGPTADGGWRVRLILPRDTTGDRPSTAQRAGSR
ncbi:sensor histidine kinase [Brachybacterium sp. FME24]|uniref:sensor histidine kinase n=1 Tax=Brachybacterium sp. FME24 TaxID=2742605 RepID=UPI0018677642|nr:histidine kinase [Brachybacterium sp. FME24]